MEVGRMIDFILVFITGVNTVNTAIARRLDNFNDKGDTVGIFDKRQSLKLNAAAPPRNVGVLNHYIHSVPVNHFARHGLCRHEEGQKCFYKAIKSKFCDTNDKFVATLVDDLCRQRGSFLDKWVRELFDIDGDGLITHFEKRYYEFENQKKN